MDCRLTIILTKPCQDCDGALLLYNQVKEHLKKFPELKFTGSITQVLDPCCGGQNVIGNDSKKT